MAVVAEGVDAVEVEMVERVDVVAVEASWTLNAVLAEGQKESLRKRLD
jgi:hypothetical protein